MTVLFCDLVGFTAASEAADPEDVRARIRPYHARLRQEIERYGGTVEKFIGDAVMAVFGAPVAHEDDAERAVRAGLRILEAIDELNEARPRRSRCRCGSGSTRARRSSALGARPEEGEGIVTGDVVNTASRLQGAAPVNGIAVSEQTYRATERVFDYEELEPVAGEGKGGAARALPPAAAPRALRLRRDPHARDPARRQGAREAAPDRHLRALGAAALLPAGDDRGRAGGGEEPPLRGALRLHRGAPRARPLAAGPLPPLRGGDRLLGARGDRQGRVRHPRVRLARGGGGEARAALARGRPRPAPGSRPASPRSSARAASPPPRRSRSPPGAASSSRGRRRGRRCSSSRTCTGRTTALLSFLEHLADWSEGVPLLLLCTARPELYEQHPAWAAGLRNATTINLAPLTDEETARLLSSLLERAVLPAETQQALLERAGGNPLYAEEFVRLLADRGRARPGRSRRSPTRCRR